jgi:hypothetical protein
LLASTQKVLSKRDFSSSTVISSAVANAMALVKNHMPKFDTEVLRKDLTIDDTAQHFVSLYDFSVLPELNDNASPGTL